MFLECNKAKTFLEKKRTRLVEENKSPFLIDEQKSKSQGVEDSSLEKKTKMFSMQESQKPMFHILENKNFLATNGIF